MCTLWRFIFYFNPCLFQLCYLIAVILFARYYDIADVVALLYCKKIKLLKKGILFLHSAPWYRMDNVKNKRKKNNQTNNTFKSMVTCTK